MNKSLLTIGIVLSLGTVGCAGVGVQHASSLTPQVQQEQGVDNLWFAAERTPTEGLDTSTYAEQGVGTLWNAQEESQTSGGVIGSFADRGLGSLWNSNL
jgi:hypothetical protein